MTAQQINRDRLRELASGATSGPWMFDRDQRDGWMVVFGGNEYPHGYNIIGSNEYLEPADAEFIAASRQAVPALLDMLGQAEQRIRDLTQEVQDERAACLDQIEQVQARDARIKAVRALHQPQTLTSLIDDDCANEMCDHEDYCPTDSTAVVCAECDRVAEAGSPYYGENGVGAALYPCPTIRALEG